MTSDLRHEAAGGPLLAASALGMSFGSGDARREVLGGVDLEVGEQEFVCIVGPSGTGKTTLLRCLGGLQRPTRGAVHVGGLPTSGPPEGVSIVFQDYSRSLFPWLRVRDNVALPLRVAGQGRRGRAEQAQRALEEVGLAGSADLYPWQLSGGMQQRVAIARAIVSRPRLLLMDEPFASVDAQTRFELEDLSRRIQRTEGVSVLLITHDIDESVYLSDRVLILSGRPASISRSIPVGLGDDRDQLATRADPLFAQLRSTVFEEIRAAAAPSAVGAAARDERAASVHR
ncbi:ABC transporter ATP-binding protein [Saccharomonospora sp. NPDC046836]|uniref:ABC transporter ATP-binding protein n=1 Tax=Saccharomonospora sp. NPDC046836 TaxID=3156921 RepID=UPI0033D7DE70